MRPYQGRQLGLGNPSRPLPSQAAVEMPIGGSGTGGPGSGAAALRRGSPGAHGSGQAGGPGGATARPQWRGGSGPGSAGRGPDARSGAASPSRMRSRRSRRPHSEPEAAWKWRPRRGRGRIAPRRLGHGSVGRGPLAARARPQRGRCPGCPARAWMPSALQRRRDHVARGPSVAVRLPVELPSA